jgi:hypothetical protein
MSSLVDFIPKFDSELGFVRIKDTDMFQLNNRVSTLLNLLSFNEGMNSIYPDMGAYIKLQTIQYSEDVESVLSNLSAGLKKYLGFDVNISWDKNKVNDDEYIINIEVEDLPGKLAFNVVRSGNFVKLINPKYVN